MKKKSALLLGAMVSVASFGPAGPAHAQDCTTLEPMPGTSTVSVENGQLRINPNGPGQDANNLTTYGVATARDLAACAVAPVPPQAWCPYYAAFEAIYHTVWGPGYVYQDPDTGEVVVDYGDLTTYTTDCVL